MNNKVKILIVEDEAIIAQVIKMDLEAAGYSVCHLASNGEKAIKFSKQDNPDLILMDVHLSSRIDGIKAAEKILSYKDIPIIFMTGYNKSGVDELVDRLNPVAFLEKPVEIRHLKSLIDEATN